jgi:uncharacterized protein (TIGR00369 family)
MRHPLSTPLGRMGIETLDASPEGCAATIPVGRLVNPVTGLPTLATVAMLVDHAGGFLNHGRRRPDEWTVTSELSLELAPDAAVLIATDPDASVLAKGRSLGPKNGSALATCELTLRDKLLGTASVRSFYISAPANSPTEWPECETENQLAATLPERMGLQVGEGGPSSAVLVQTPDPVLNSSMGIVHGGISAAALELVASAALNTVRKDTPLNTASLRVNYLRPFRGGPQSRYVGTVLRAGRGSGVAEAQAIGDDGVVALIARLTAYR